MSLRPPPVDQRARSVDSGLSSKTLCAVCKSIDFRRYLYEDMKSRVCLGTVNELDPTCPFCRLLFECVNNCRRKVSNLDKLYLSNFEAWNDCVVLASTEFRGIRLLEDYSNFADQKAIAAASGASKRYRFIVRSKDSKLGSIQYLPSRPMSFFGQRVNPNLVDMALVKSWLTSCQRHHGRSCGAAGEASKRLRFFRVIDINSRTVISAPSECSYATLSYVWGQKEFFKSRTKDLVKDEKGEMVVKLPERLPATFEDAIFVTHSLGLRYLWIDALCIIQDSDVEVDTLMKRMDAIYNSAEVTIVAAAGQTVESGLAGIIRPRQQTQRVEVVKDLPLVVVFPRYNAIERDESIKWNQRGWTFQEKILSKRILLFTECQVYFQCSNTAWSEDVVVNPRLSFANTKRWRPLRWAADRHIGQPSDLFGVKFSNYVAIIEAYSRRDLTRRYDGINAIQGVLTTMKREMGKFFFGLPENYFGQALLWHPKIWSVSKPWPSGEALLPTWTWARWELPQGCTWQSTIFSKEINLASSMFVVEPQEMSEVLAPTENRQPPLYANENTLELGWAPNRVSNLQHMKYPSLQLRPIQENILYFAKGLLYFRTFFVRVQIGGRDHSVDYDVDHDVDDIQRPLEIRQYRLTDGWNGCLGYIRMSEAVKQDYVQKHPDYVTLCWSRGYNGPSIDKRYVPVRQEIKTNSDDKQYTMNFELPESEFLVAHVMLVDWIGGVAHRVAVGAIVEPAWSKFRWKRPHWVLLG